MENQHTRRAEPPEGVSTTAEDGRAYIPLKEAANRVGCDRRTMQSAIISGETAGWVKITRQSLRWFVYEDALPDSPVQARLDDLTARLERLESAVVVKAGQHALETADLRAQLVASRETNLLLLQVNELLSAAHKEAAEDGLRSQGSANRQGELLREASARYAQALSLTMTPGHAGSLAATPASDDSR